MGILSGSEVERPIVKVRISDGLGNQMFQAAAGMALAQRLDANLEFGIYEYGRDQLRKYELDRFELGASTYSGPRWKFSERNILIQKIRNRLLAQGQLPTTIWRQSGFHFNEDIASLAGNVCLRGTFQSHRYFESASNLIRGKFSLLQHLSDRGKELAVAAQGDMTVAVHVRRGDYLNNQGSFPILTADYYRKALGLIAKTVRNPRLFVVTDDLHEAREALADWPDAIFAECTTQFDDMHLISACRHRVIANSSFSWWGGFLGSRHDGITVAPRTWFTRKLSQTFHLGDLFPPGWLLV